jgi:hypothetical protein
VGVTFKNMSDKKGEEDGEQDQEENDDFSEKRFSL